jgi:hypothetical protein
MYIDHLDENKGKCRKGFMQELVERAAKVAGALEINHHDKYNEVRSVAKESKAAANTCVTVSLETYEELSAIGKAAPPMYVWSLNHCPMTMVLFSTPLRELTSDFNVSLATIMSRIKSKNLEVFHPTPEKISLLGSSRSMVVSSRQLKCDDNGMIEC